VNPKVIIGRIINKLSHFLFKIKGKVKKQSKKEAKNIVFFVPKKGIEIKAEKKVPMILPRVEKAKTKPDFVPIFSFSFAKSLIIKGLTMPSKVTGKMKRSKVVKKEPNSKAKMAEFSIKDLRVVVKAIGFIKNGIKNVTRPAKKIIFKSNWMSGYLSDILPPKK
jgi:beta-lactam-binding protein with PASTA domain